MHLSRFGEKFSKKSGILQLMDDLGRAMATDSSVCMLGGGNPGHIAAVEDRLKQRMTELMNQPGGFEKMIGDYATPQGHLGFIAALAELFRDTFGWQVGPQNIALTNGSQTSLFFLFNMLAGTDRGGHRRRILFPVSPEYIGYTDLGLEEDIFATCRPAIEQRPDGIFKYHVDFSRLRVDADTAALCVSRPTNPTGNVLTDSEIEHLSALAAERDIPLIIDNAYGLPFPAIIYTDATLKWTPRLIVCMSLSKLGLPGARTGIVVADRAVIDAVAGMNAVFSLAPGSIGAALMVDLVRSREILQLGREIVRPYYQAKRDFAVAQVRASFGDTPCLIHDPEGAFFLWLWFPELPITTESLYERLKARGVIVVPGRHFFPGLDDPEWRHPHECIRISYSQEDAVVQRGVAIIADAVREAYRAGG